jgi:hypothetical protein
VRPLLRAALALTLLDQVNAIWKANTAPAKLFNNESRNLLCDSPGNHLILNHLLRRFDFLVAIRCNAIAFRGDPISLQIGQIVTSKEDLLWAAAAKTSQVRAPRVASNRMVVPNPPAPRGLGNASSDRLSIRGQINRKGDALPLS